MTAVLRAKLYGSWLLHRALAEVPTVRFFVGYSSIASVLGSAGQANYAAGNAYLDALMQVRAAAGLPGLSVNWGPWAQIGMAASLTDRQIAGIEARGLKFVKPDAALNALFAALARPYAQTVVGEFDWDAYTNAQPTPDALLAELGSARDGAPDRAELDVDELLARPKPDREAALRSLLRARIADVLRYDSPDEIDLDARFVDLGLDSLGSVELKNALETVLGVPLPASALFDHPEVRSLAVFLDEQLVPDGAGDAPAAPPRENPGEDVRELTDAEADDELDALREMFR